MRKRTCRVTAILIILTMMCLTLGGCSGGSTKLAEGFDEAVLKTEAEALVQAINDNNYEEFIKKADDTMKGAIPQESFESKVVEYAKSKGTFDSIDKEVVVGQKDEKSGTEFGVVVVVAKYSDGNIQYTISYDKDMNLVGFYLK